MQFERRKKLEKKKIAVLIACYNEEATIAKVVKDYKAMLPDADVYVCDNNSTDMSVPNAFEAGAIILKEKKQGKGAVYRKLFKEVEADYYITTDADDTYPPDKVLEMVNIATEGVDMVIGDRLNSTYFTENKRPFHNFGNRIVRFLINFLYHTDITDIMTGSRVLSRKLVKAFPSHKDGFEVETELTIFALNNNFKIASVVIPYHDRIGSASKLNTIKDGIKVLLTILEYGILKRGGMKR